MTPIKPVHQNARGAPVADLHAGLLFLVRNQAGISDNDRRLLEQGLASDLRDQVYGARTADLVRLFQEQLASRFNLVVNGDVDQATAGAFNTHIAEVGAGAQTGAAAVLSALNKDIAAGTALLQSPYLYAQAAGSDGSDGSADANHVRWTFLRGLGDNHLPKGNLAVSQAGSPPPYPAHYGLNKADDFVTLLRALYSRPYPLTVNFAIDRPVSLVEAGPQRLWKFNVTVPSTYPAQHREVVLRFTDIARYDTVRASLNPLQATDGFIFQYPGAVEIEVTGQLCFALSLFARASTAESRIRAEAVSVTENVPDAELFVSCRRRFTIASTPEVQRICAENVRYFRFDHARCMLYGLQLETYEQFLIAMMQHNVWQVIGTTFALSRDDNEVFGRLEDGTLANVNRKWPRYVGADAASGLFTASVPNYRAKWDPTRPPSSEPTDDNGLKKAVIRYLTLSMSSANPTALAALPAKNPVDGAAFDISYLQMLNLVALDFHVARMLGLGCLDPNIAPGNTAKYVYLAIYRTTAALEPGSPAAPHTHLYMTLPTGRPDHRLPPAPVQEAPTFGIAFDTGTATPMQLTDAAGYTPFDDARIINLHLAPYDTMQALGPFFVPPVEFCSSDVTKPVFYGCKYKLVSEANYRKPELSDDTEFLDPSGVPEVAPILPQASAIANAPNPPIYTHEERENGLHRYAFYGVNWFARPGPMSNPQDVDTLIPIRHTLLPPANLAVQLIQPEDPLILTTLLEQQKLPTSGDATLVRCTFDWNHNHYIPQKFSPTNVYADKVQLFFRPAPPRAVQGVIKSVASISDTLVEVRTESYTLASVSPPQTVVPAIVPGDEPRFVGSSFAANQVLYAVDSVAQSTVAGEGAVFRLHKRVQSTAADLNHNNQFVAGVQVSVPSVGDRFLVAENMNETANWGANQPLAKEVTLVNFLDGGQLHTETVSYPDGSQTTFNIGGIQQNVSIIERSDPGSTNSASKSGIFDISFASYQLAAHPDADVEWYRGIVRVPEAATGNLKALQVWKIDASGATLTLTAYDPTFNVDANYVPLPGYSPIRTGPNVPVNFHPGYRVYLKAQPGVLDETTTLPGLAEDGKQTFLAARSCNTALASESNLTAPVVMQARKISPPLAPDEPIGPLYATRPNVQGKGTWTMDVKVAVDSARAPYALVFYRANERAVLDTLYNPATVDAVVAELAALPAADAAFAANRWKDLVNVQNLHSDHGFHQYTPGGYRFPIPNNGAYVIPGTAITPFAGGVNRPGDPNVTFTVDDKPMSMLEAVKGAIDGAFLPLTESPVAYRFIKSGTQTSARKPVVRDGNGDRLPLTSPAFDPAPMAVKYAAGGDTMVRFTDYTLDGAAANIYFYYAAEMSDQMKLSDRSPIAGPVHLVNAYPAEAPVIRKVTSVIEDPVLQIPTGVKLVVNAYIASEGIAKFNLYRATDPNDAATVRTMTLVGTFDAMIGSETELLDDFSDLDFPPFGDPLFYRVVALRKITNERGADELISSLPSAPARASVVDVKNPVAPRLTFSSDPPTVSYPVQLTNVVLSWRRAAYNPTYYLYKQDVSGNWNRIYTQKTNAAQVDVPLSATAVADGTLLKQDADGKPICHRFKLEVENSSGSFSLNEDVLSVPATRQEAYAFFAAVLNYADDYQPASPLADRLCDPAVTTFPGKMTFADIIASLPTGHVFDRTEITVADGLGHAARKSIAFRGGAVTFNHGDGTGIVLDGSVANVAYDVRAKVFTDSCPDGLEFRYVLRFGPEIALMGLTSVLSYTDSTTTTSPLGASLVASGLQFPTTMTFTDITVLPAGHTFVRIDVLVEDDTGASFAKSIGAAGASVTFNQGDGGLALDGSLPNRVYQISARLFTNLSPNGVLFNYSISYG